MSQNGVAWTSPRWWRSGHNGELHNGWARGPDDVWIVTWQQANAKSAVFHGRWVSGEPEDQPPD
jgi:hypothetical protein